MHRVLKVDGLDYVVVLDGLGLSSWCLPDEVFSDLDIHGSSDAVMSTDATGRRLLVWDDGDDRSHLVAADTLEHEQRYARSELKPSFLDASGEALLQVDLAAPRQVERCDLSGAVGTRAPLPFPSQLAVALSTGPSVPVWTRPRCAGGQGQLAVVTERGSLLLADFRDFKRPRVLASGLLEVPPEWDVQLTPLDDALGVIAHDLADGKAIVWVISGRDVLAKKTLAALSMPAFAGRDAVLTQTSDGALLRVSLRDGSTRELQLPEVGRETKLDPRGAGTPIAGGGITAFLPWHGESLILFDDATGEPSEVSRMLPENAREVRRFILQRLRMANEAARSTGTCFELAGLDFAKKRKDYTVKLSAHGGDGGLWARTVLETLQGMISELSGHSLGGWWLTTLRLSGFPAERWSLTSEDEVASILTRMIPYGFRLAHLALATDKLYEHRPFLVSLREPAQPLLTDGAALLLLQAFLAGFNQEEGMGLTTTVARLRTSPEPMTAMLAQVPRLHASHAKAEPRVLTAMARLAAVHLKAEAGRLLITLATKAPREYLTHAKRGVLEVMRWWSRQYPAVAKPLVIATADTEVRLALNPDARVS